VVQVFQTRDAVAVVVFPTAALGYLARAGVAAADQVRPGGAVVVVVVLATPSAGVGRLETAPVAGVVAVATRARIRPVDAAQC
jgi:hypothetical protein